MNFRDVSAVIYRETLRVARHSRTVFVSQWHDLRVTVDRIVSCVIARERCAARTMSNFLPVGFQPVDRYRRSCAGSLVDLSSCVFRSFRGFARISSRAANFSSCSHRYPFHSRISNISPRVVQQIRIQIQTEAPVPTLHYTRQFLFSIFISADPASAFLPNL